jgi:copper transport protein
VQYYLPSRASLSRVDVGGDVRHIVTSLVLTCALVVAFAVPAVAHTGLDGSTPKDGVSVTAPVDELTLRFTQPITLAGPGVEVLDAGGGAVASDVAVDGARVTVTPARPLSGGRYGVRWRVRSGDAHPVDGSYTFTVRGTVAASEAATPLAGAVASTPPRDPASESPAATTSPVDAGPTSADGLDAALGADQARGITVLDQLLRAVFYTAALAAVGVLAFLITSWEGNRREARQLTRVGGRLAVAAMAVTAAQVAVRSARAAGSWAGMSGELLATLSGGYLIGASLRLGGAVLMSVGIVALRRSLCAHVPPIAGGAVDLTVDGPRHVEVPAWTPVDRLRDGATATIGALLLIGSFAFIGHAATATPRAVSTLAVMAHAAATALWCGGLLGLVVTLQVRRRYVRPLHAGLVAARFSVLATVGVTLAAVAGVALSSVRLERVDELWTTGYGLVLLGKVAAVAVVGALGAYNHFRLVPALRRGGGSAAANHLRRVGLVELALLTVVAGLTSALVGLAG